MNNIPRLLIAATHSGAGKTIVTAGLIAAAHKLGLRVQPFKSGPDYIDPGYHTQAANTPCRNLDTWLLPPKTILELFAHSAQTADLAIIEGVMGLYDGAQGGTGAGSSAELAKLLNAPVLLVLDAKGLGQSAAAMALGYQQLDQELNLAGIIINRAGSPNHYRLLKESIQQETSLPVLGYLPRCEELTLAERHLGLVPQVEQEDNVFWDKLITLANQHLDLGAILNLARQAPALPDFTPNLFAQPSTNKRVTLAIAKDKAFHFYYQDNLDLLNHWGADIAYFSPLNDETLPAGSCGVYIGGGYPELFAKQLSTNTSMLKTLRQANQQGMPIYAECGGLMYLSQGLFDGSGDYYPLAGLVPAKTRMLNKRQALGYVKLEVLQDNLLSLKSEQLRGHEFHWSALEELHEDTNYAYCINNARGEKRSSDGLLGPNLLASYAHLHFASHPILGQRLLQACKRYQESIP